MEYLDILMKLRDGKEVKCTLCNKGYLKPYKDTEYKTTHCFQCDYCKEFLNIN